MADSPGSPLSSLASDDFTEDIKFDDTGTGPPSPGNSTPHMPPSKRRRTGASTWDRHTPISSIHEDMPPPGSPTASISSDSSRELPNSPTSRALMGSGLAFDEDYSGLGRDQVTVCQWEGCDAGDLGHMDALVKHIHDEHIGSRQKKYLCEWRDCPRKGQTHASGYALRAHVRSHTREKPFYCTLPECDRSFTRSDALTKHIRTVHETEALRSSDTTAKHPGSGQGAGGPGKLPRIKLKLSQPPKEGVSNGEKSEIDEITKEIDAINTAFLDPDLGFDHYELSLSLEYLYRLLRRHIHWAEQESEKLKQEWESIMEERKTSWRQKEAILDDMILAETRVFKPDVTPGFFAVSRGDNGASSLEGGSTVPADTSSRTGDTAMADSGLPSHRSTDMAPPPPIERLDPQPS